MKTWNFFLEHGGQRSCLPPLLVGREQPHPPPFIPLRIPGAGARAREKLISRPLLRRWTIPHDLAETAQGYLGANQGAQVMVPKARRRRETMCSGGLWWKVSQQARQPYY